MKDLKENNTIALKLETGTFTWQQLCNKFEWSYNTSAKPNQLLELQRHCLYEVVGAGKGQRFHIIKVYDQPTTDKPFYLPYGDIYGNHQQVLVPKHLLDYSSMIIYRIVYGNQVYIGSTTRPRNRISEHFNGSANDMTYSMLQRGATFELLEHVTTSEEDLRQREAEYIKEYAATGVYVVINDRHNNSNK
jgi:predicted GIY-YIG superfamily endonuclease